MQSERPPPKAEEDAPVVSPPEAPTKRLRPVQLIVAEPLRAAEGEGDSVGSYSFVAPRRPKKV